MNYDQAGTSTRATRMDVDQDPQGQETPPSTPFEDGFTRSTTKDNTTADPTNGVNTENFFTPHYTESPEIDHTNTNTNQQAPATIRTRLEAIRDAELAADVAAAAAEAKASASSAANEMEAYAKMEAEAVATVAAETTAHLAAKAVAAAEAATAAETTA